MTVVPRKEVPKTVPKDAPHSEDDKSNDTWLVTDRSGRRVLFEGTEDDARRHVESYFPRLHVEPGTNYGSGGPEADAYVKSPGNELSWYNGDDWYKKDKE